MLKDAPSILEYAPSSESDAEPRLGTNETSVRVTFCVQPQWLYVLKFLPWFLFVSFQLFVAGKMFLVMYELHRASGIPLWTTVNIMSLISALILPLWWIPYLAIELWRLHRWGRVAKILTATSAGLTLYEMGWFKPRTQYWPVDDIGAILLHQRRWSIVPGRRAARLQITIYGFAGTRTFTFTVIDPQLPERITEQLAMRLGRPMKIRSSIV